MKRNSGRRIALLVAALTVVAMFAVPAWAQNEPYSNDGPEVKPTLISNDSDPAEVLPNRIERPGVLPFTGGDVTMFLVIGLGAISVGVVLLRARSAHSKS